MKTVHLVLVCLTFACLLLSPLRLSGSVEPTLTSVDIGTVPRGVAVDPTTGHVYALLFLNGTTRVLDSRTLAYVASIPTASPYAVGVNTVTGRVYVSLGTGGISVISEARNSVVSSIGIAGSPFALAVDSVTNQVFAADPGSGALWIVDGSTGSVSGRIHITGVSALAVDPTIGEAFVGNLTSPSRGSIVEVSTSGSVVKSTQIPFAPGRFALDPSLHLLYVTGSSSTGVNFLAFDDLTLQPAYSLTIHGSPNIVTVDSSSDVYVSDTTYNRLYELAGSTGDIMMNSSGGSGLTYTGITGMAFDSGTGKLFITESEVAGLLVLSTGAAVSQGTSTVTLYLLLLATPALASGAVGLVAILYIRRKRPSP